MQVTHVADHVTHAVIGGAQTIEFGISNDAAFFQILSSTLYSNQRLAVAREVLCNAWDAHIRAGCTNLSVKVTLDDDHIVVRDYAMGIAHDMMGPLYGTYGGSDKKNNGQETGGFGLGCKAPFAYADHFEVTSWHKGIKTIYNLSKSSADRHGKPGITPIVSVPTDETGLQVKIPMKTRMDKHDFETYFSRIAKNGEMNVELNGKTIETFPISKSTFNWFMTSEEMGESRNDRVFVRYGNVIYPVASHPKFEQAYTLTTKFLDRLNTYGTMYRIVFQAEPDTISVTPSRESLSMQEYTVDTLDKLLHGFIGHDLTNEISTHSLPVLEAQIIKMVDEEKIGDLLQADKKIPGYADPDDYKVASLAHIGNLESLTAQYLCRNYPATDSFYRRDMELRIQGAIKLGSGHRGHLEFIERATANPKALSKKQRKVLGGYGQKCPRTWFNKRVLRPLYRDMQADSVMDIKRLQIIEAQGAYGKARIVPPFRMDNVRALADYLPLFRKIIVISYAQGNIWDKVKMDKDIQKWGGPEHVWFYHAPMAKTRIQAVRDFFIKQGFNLVDYTAEEVMAEVRKSKPPKDLDKLPKPRLPGFPLLNGVYAANKMTRIDNCFLPDVQRIQFPLCYEKIIYTKAEFNPLKFSHFEKKNANRIITLFGGICAVVRTEPQENKLKEAGIMELTNYITNYVCERVSKSPEFLAYWEESYSRAAGHRAGCTASSTVTECLFDIPQVRAALGLTTSLSDQDLLILHLWRDMQTHWYMYENARGGSYRYTGGPIAVAAKDIITALPVSLALADIIRKAKSMDIEKLFDTETIENIVSSAVGKINDDRLNWLVKVAKTALLG